MTGSAMECNEMEMDVAFEVERYKWVGGPGEGSRKVLPDRRPADDGKRNGVYEMEMDVAFEVVRYTNG